MTMPRSTVIESTGRVLAWLLIFAPFAAADRVVAQNMFSPDSNRQPEARQFDRPEKVDHADRHDTDIITTLTKQLNQRRLLDDIIKKYSIDSDDARQLRNLISERVLADPFSSFNKMSAASVAPIMRDQPEFFPPLHAGIGGDAGGTGGIGGESVISLTSITAQPAPGANPQPVPVLAPEIQFIDQILNPSGSPNTAGGKAEAPPAAASQPAYQLTPSQRDTIVADWVSQQRANLAYLATYMRVAADANADWLSESRKDSDLRRRVIERTNFYGEIVFWAFISMLALALLVAAIEFWHAHKLRRRAMKARPVKSTKKAREDDADEAAQEELSFSLEGIAVKSSRHGTILITLALAAMFIFVRYIYPVQLVGKSGDIAPSTTPDTSKPGASK